MAPPHPPLPWLKRKAARRERLSFFFNPPSPRSHRGQKLSHKGSHRTVTCPRQNTRRRSDRRRDAGIGAEQTRADVYATPGVPGGTRRQVEQAMKAEKEIYNARYRELVAQLKATRQKAGMTQADAAGRLGYAAHGLRSSRAVNWRSICCIW